MEGLTRLVAESMERHGLETPLDHRRLQWSRWFRLESSLDLVLVPSKPGLFAIGEEVVPAGNFPGGKRMLAIFHIGDSNDLPISLCRLFTAGSPLRERISESQISNDSLPTLDIDIRTKIQFARHEVFYSKPLIGMRYVTQLCPQC